MQRRPGKVRPFQISRSESGKNSNETNDPHSFHSMTGSFFIDKTRSKAKVPIRLALPLLVLLALLLSFATFRFILVDRTMGTKTNSPSTTVSTGGNPTETHSPIDSPRIRSYLQHDPDREPIFKILFQANYNLNDESMFSNDTLAMLPKWSEVTTFYGSPKVIGLEHCSTYQQFISIDSRTIGVAGTFNSGTNLLSELLQLNCHIPGGILWQVPWGKHLPASMRGNHTTRDNQHIPYKSTLPVVTVRDPYTWMQSMCRQSYNAQFEHAKQHSCPNIIPYPSDIQAHPRFATMEYIPVHVTYPSHLKVRHASLVHMWNEWYNEYVHILPPSIPRLIVRMEDLLFHGQDVITTICHCAGGTMETTFHHLPYIANQHYGIDRNHTEKGLIRSLIQYGNISSRRIGYPSFQLQAVQDLLDVQLMELFGYPYERN